MDEKFIDFLISRINEEESDAESYMSWSNNADEPAAGVLKKISADEKLHRTNLVGLLGDIAKRGLKSK